MTLAIAFAGAAAMLWSSGAPRDLQPGRRDTVRIAIALPLAALPRCGCAYDAIPSAVVDPATLAAQRESKKRAREAAAANKNSEVASLVERVAASKASNEFVEAIDSLSLWVISQGPPSTPLAGSQWTTAEDRSPLPEGFKTRELVATCKAALNALPQIAYACEMTRENKGICYSAGPQAESAYKAFLAELKKRAPLQYDTPCTCTLLLYPRSNSLSKGCHWTDVLSQTNIAC